MKIELNPVVALTGAALLALSLSANWAVFVLNRAPAPEALRRDAVTPAKPAELRPGSIRFVSYRNTVEFKPGAPFSLEELTKAVRITPELPFKVETRYADDTYDLEADWAPESFYQVRIELPAAADGTPRKPLEVSFVTDQSDPLIAFATEGTFYPRNGELWELPLKIRNVTKIEASLDLMYANTIVDWHYNDDKTRPIGKAEFTVKPARNTIEPWTLPLQSLLSERKPGLYKLTLNSPDGNCYNNQLLVVTDLGISAAISGSQVFAAVRSLTDGKPIADAELTLISRKNQPLAQGYTDKQGLATLEFSLADDPEDEPRLLLVSKADDRAFLDRFARGSRLDQGDAVTQGSREPAPGQAVRALLHTERGIIRPGETLHCFVQLKDKKSLAVPEAQPVEIVLRDPDYRIVQRAAATTDAYGTAAVEFALPQDAVTGYYQIKLEFPGAAKSAPSGDSCSILVAHFVPDQIKVALEALPPDAPLATPLEVTGSARYYFDAPVGNQEVSLHSEYAYVPFLPEEYKEFRFGPVDAPEAPPRKSVTVSTDPEGRFTGAIPIPVLPSDAALPNMPLKINVVATVTGSNGLTVGSFSTAYRHANPWYLGIRRIDDRTQFEWIALRPDGSAAAAPGPLHYELLERRWNYVTREVDNTWKRVWIEELIPAGEGEIAAPTASRGNFEVAIARPGDYRLRVTDPAAGIRGEVDFYYWFGDGGGVRAANPSVLTFSTDRENYLPGAVAEVKFTLPSPGLVLAVSGVSEAEHVQTATGKAGENTLTIPIPADFTGGSWYTGVTVLIHDPTHAKEPQRLFGVARMNVDQSRHRIAVTLDTPAASRPNQTETIVVTLKDGSGAPVRGKVQLWAVDAGILSLTNWSIPDPFARFYGPREGTLEFCDTYGQLYPALRLLPDGRIGGDGMAWTLRRTGGFSADYEDSAVVVLPAVETDAAGRVEIPITWPNHTGAMRLMATAAGKTGAGSAEREITLRDPATVRVTVPAAVAPQDEFEVTLEIFNHEFETLQGQWQLRSVGDVTVTGDGTSGDVKLAKGDHAVIKRRFRAGNHPGAAGMVAQLATADGSHWDNRAGFAIRPMSAYGTRTISYVVAPGASLTLACNPDDWFGGSLTRQIEIGGSPAARLSGCLGWLNSYPYGCAEQTAATAFPYLGIPALVKNGLLPEHFLAQRDRTVNDAIRRLQNMRNGYGSFGMWPGGDGEWTDLTLFATHFLMEAESCGYAVDADWRRELLHNLSRMAADKDNTPRQRAYAVYVAALAGKPLPGIAEELLNSTGDDDLTGFLAAAGLMKSGRTKAGAEQLDRFLARQVWRTDAAKPGWYTPAMRLGLMLWITMDLVPEHPAVHTMAQELAAMLDTDRGSTQDNAWAALGLERWSAVYGAAEGAGKITLADGTVREFAGKEPFRSDLPTAAVTVTNTGTGNLYVDEFLHGIPVRPLPCTDGLTVTRRYLNEAGNEVTEVKPGEIMTVEVTLQSAGAVDSIVLTDLLPGGVAIEDERLATRYAPIMRAQRDKNSPLQVRMLEKGADRLLLFGDLTGDAPAVFSYRVRAVTQGCYQLPPIEAEAMYQPKIRACTVFDGKTLTVR